MEPGIYKERARFYVVARLGSRKTEALTAYAYFDLDAPLEAMRAWRHRALADLLDRRPERARAGTLAADVEPFLRLIEDGPRRTDLRRLLVHWAESPLGARSRHDLTRAEILAQRARWLEDGAAASTVNHRVRALRALYHGLDGGPTEPHPTDKITRIPPDDPEPRGIPMPYVDLILAALPDRGRAARFEKQPKVSVTKIRLRIIAYTGIPHAGLRRLRPRDVDFEGGRIYLKPRRKGKGAAGKWLDLLPEAVEALRDFDQAHLWGKSFARSSMHKSFRKAIARVERRLASDKAALKAFRDAVPPNPHPYDLRHSFATEAYRVTGDPRAVAELLQHAPGSTMVDRYTTGAVSERVSIAVAKMTEARRTPHLALVRSGSSTG